MLRHLFPGLTRDRDRGSALMSALTKRARDPSWFIEGEVPDTVDGRFRVLATLTALAMVSLERFGSTGEELSVALTEQYAALMEAEHREMGLGDPTLGKTVRLLVGALARRVGVWRSALAGDPGWASAARDSVYEADPDPDALAFTAEALRAFWDELGQKDLDALEQGDVQ